MKLRVCMFGSLFFRIFVDLLKSRFNILGLFLIVMFVDILFFIFIYEYVDFFRCVDLFVSFSYVIWEIYNKIKVCVC